jgi:ribosomal protein L40E
MEAKIPMYCTKCGTQRSEGDGFCRKCGSRLSNATATPPPTSSPVTPTNTFSPNLVCPKCGSANVQKYSLWKKSSGKGIGGIEAGLGVGLGAGLGCLSGSAGCLIVLLLLIFAPLLLLLFGLGLAMVFPVIIAVIAIATIGLIVYAVVSNYDSGHYICLKCNHIFKP